MNTTTSGDHPVPFDDPRTAPKKKMFVTDDGRNVLFTFILLISLFALWRFCNGMIDVMDKHFQEELGLTLAQSAWVQFAHYLGYFLMALPAGWLATKMGYKGGIIAGLLLVAVGGFWFIPATQIAAFWAFLLGVCTLPRVLPFSKPSLIPTRPFWGLLNTERPASILRNLATASVCFSDRLLAACFLFQRRGWTEHGRRAALDSLRRHRGYRHHSRRYILFCRCS